MISQDSVWLDKGFVMIVVITITGGIIAFLGVHYFLVQPLLDESDRLLAESKAKSKAELTDLKSMSCSDIGNWLLKDSWYDRYNLVWAQNHYLVSCK